MFAELTTREKSELAARLWRAGARFDAEYLALNNASPQTLTSYGVCRGGLCQCPERQHLIPSDWLMAAIDCFQAARTLGPQELVWCGNVNAPAHYGKHRELSNCRHPHGSGEYSS